MSLSHLAAQGDKVRGVVICGHAMFCNRRAMDRPAGEGLGTQLAKSGFETYLVDLRGHGQSGPAASRNVDFSYDDIVLRDIPAVIRHVAALHPDLPLVWLGHSLGGHAGLAALAVDRSLPVAAVVNFAGNVWIRSLEPDRWMWARKLAISMTWALISRLHGYFPARRYNAGTDPAGATYVRQLTENALYDRWGSLCGRYDYLSELRWVRTPILSVVGIADTWMCSPLAARLWLDHAVRAEVTHWVVEDPPGVDHMGLVLNSEMEPVWAQIADWITNAISADPTLESPAVTVSAQN